MGDALSDYLVGVHEAAIEIEVAEQGGLICLQAFLEDDEEEADRHDWLVRQISDYGRELADIFSVSPPTLKVEFIEDQDWAENWKVHFKPFTIAPGLVIAPSWEHYEKDADEQVIVMDPGMAFGTGHHETTRLCLEIMQQSQVISSGCQLLDVGTGTGILGMAALLFGASRVVAVDNDPEAVGAALANCRLNNLANRMEISGRSLTEIEEPFEFVAANIVHDTLLEIADELARLTAERRYLLLSGLIDGPQSENMQSCFGGKGFQLVDRRTDGLWCALLFNKKERTGNPA